MRSGVVAGRCGEWQSACRKCCSKKGAAPVAGLATSSDEQRPAEDVWFSVSLALKLPNLRLKVVVTVGATKLAEPMLGSHCWSLLLYTYRYIDMCCCCDP
jgi:hypothetical protein